LLAAFAVALVAVVALVIDPSGALAVSAPPPTDPSGSVVDNPFLPENRDLSDCISAVPQPGCGSEARGGWRQALVFGVVLVALAFIVWQIARTVRRSRRAIEHPEDVAAGRRRGP
jgi:hypothetical protein